MNNNYIYRNKIVLLCRRVKCISELEQSVKYSGCKKNEYENIIQVWKVNPCGHAMVKWCR